MKVCITCSHGGHLTEILQIMDSFQGHETFFITYESVRSDSIKNKYTIKNIGKNPLKFLICLPTIFNVLRREKPDVVVSTGAEIAIPVFYIARLLGIRTIFIESVCRVSNLSMTGKLIYPASNVFLVQWEQLLTKCGKKGQYWGRVL